MSKLHHRIPIPVRHHWRLITGTIVLLALVIGLLGAYRVRPLVLGQADDDADEKSTVDIAGTVDLFATDTAHTVTVQFPQDAYDRMITDFQAADEKAYVEADLVIDGTPVPGVGIRLKGNSTLMALRRGTTGRAGPAATLSVDAPESLPWLISFDHFVKDRTYQGHEQIAVRPDDRSGGTANEALALALVGLAGEPTQRFGYTAFTVNDRPTVSRLLVEVPDDGYADDLGHGVLYKALSTSTFAYQGDDPTAYEDDFDQINRTHSHDLDPLIKLLAWVDQSSDAEFVAGLADHVDVDSFASYVALQNLLLNFDDMAGPGKNYYLWYDLDTKRFSVLSWDLNLALSGDANQGPYDAGRIGAGGVVGGPGIVGGPGAGGGPGVVAVPGGGGAFAGGGAGGGGAGGGGPGGFRAGNKLKERFLELFKPAYEQAYRQAYQTLFAGGGALRALSDLTTTSTTMAGPAATDQTTQLTALRTLIENRTKALATFPVITAR
jgi:spore coat protein CotH